MLKELKMEFSRRSFLKTSGAAYALGASHAHPILAGALGSRQSLSPASRETQSSAERLDQGWEFYNGPLDPRFQVWHSEELLTWETVTLPHCFNHYDGCDPDTPAYRGPGWYRRKLEVANPYRQGRTLLHFEAAGQRAEIYVGTKLVAQHSCGYDEFTVDITDACLDAAEVPLAVLCDNGRDIERMPSDLSDFTLYGGLYRPVHLVYVPAVSLDVVHTHVQFEPGKGATVPVYARLYAPVAHNGSVHVELSIYDPHSVQKFHQALDRALWKDEVELAECILLTPDLWSPDSPGLYTCELILTHRDDDSAQPQRSVHRFGVRHVRWEEHGPFFLNGERLELRGTHRHEDHAGYAAAVPEDLVRQEMTLMKAMGANFLRLAHYQQSALVLDLCDELGILVWEEVPWCRSGVGGELFQERGRTQLRAMIDQHRNHPSVLMWSLGNEDDWPTELNSSDHAAIRRYMTELRDLAHALDPSRVTALRRCDFALDIPDVYSPSIWAGWYSGAYTEYRDALEKWRPRAPHLFHAEWGADSHAGRHAEDPDPVLAHILTGQGTAEKGFAYKLTGGPVRVAKDGEWSETYACDLFDWYLKTQHELPWLTGSAQWIFKDFTTSLRTDNPVPRVNQKGLLTRDMTPKEGYYVFQSWWAAKPMVHIYGHNWPIRWGNPGQERLVRVYSNCAAVELFLNGQSMDTKKRNPQDFPAAGLRWSIPFRPGNNELRAVVRDGTQDLSDAVSFFYETRKWGSPAALALALKENSASTARIEASLLDGAGVRCLDSRAFVRFSLAGDGRLIDNLGTPTGSRLVQLYNGRAEISLELHGEAVASVTSKCVHAGFLRING
jgi:beta-galactosidase